MAVIALFAIARKRRELERAFAKPSADRRALRRAIHALDAAAEQLRDTRKPQRLPVVRPIYEALRRAGRPLTSIELAAAVMAARGAPASQALRVRRRTDDALYDLEARGKLRRTKRGGRRAWQLP